MERGASPASAKPARTMIEAARQIAPGTFDRPANALRSVAAPCYRLCYRPSIAPAIGIRSASIALRERPPHPLVRSKASRAAQDSEARRIRLRAGGPTANTAPARHQKPNYLRFSK